ncbi:hypothetical protein V6S02_03495 [Microbacterium sp. CCNWLW134]|uniref:hypothetical protein n=1 Tax=Microbacterium sp. CCNWLW134 TaxID=3122064 RepID=UPI0030102424
MTWQTFSGEPSDQAAAAQSEGPDPQLELIVRVHRTSEGGSVLTWSYADAATDSKQDLLNAALNAVRSEASRIVGQ